MCVTEPPYKTSTILSLNNNSMLNSGSILITFAETVPHGALQLAPLNTGSLRTPRTPKGAKTKGAAAQSKVQLHRLRCSCTVTGSYYLISWEPKLNGHKDRKRMQWHG